MRTALWIAIALAASPAPALAQANAKTVTTAIISAQGVVSRPPDVATVNLNITTNDDASVVATAKNTAVYEALKTALATLGVDNTQIKTTFYNVVYVPRPAPVTDGRPVSVPVPISTLPRFGYLVSRQLQLSVTNVGNVGKIVEAALAAGATNVNGIVFGLADRKSANAAAMAQALADAATQANIVSGATHMRIVGIKQIQVGANNGFQSPTPIRFPNGVPQTGGIDLPPASVEVRSDVTVTYLLR